MFFRAGLALSVTFGDTSPKGRGFRIPEGAKTPFRSGNSVRGFSFALASTMSTLISYAFIICHSPQKSSAAQKVYKPTLSFCKFLIHVLVTFHQLPRRGQHIVICCGLHGIRLVEITLHSSLSFFMPNSLRSKPLRHLGLLRTTTCIEPTTFRRLIRHYRRSAPGMFRFSSGSARPAPSPPPPARPFGWRW